jgi:L-threonylcarbamoyladenylate synthase
MPLSFPIHKAGRILKSGGVVAYPTEGVFGIGCLPDNVDAIERVLTIKRRDPSQGLILIAASIAQLARWIDGDCQLPLNDATPITWIVPASAAVPPWITGRHSGLAVRITSHPVAAALCDAAGSALVSTSANISGRRPAANALVLRRQFHSLVDCIVPGRCGSWIGPSEIRDLMSGRTLRAAGQ